MRYLLLGLLIVVSVSIAQFSAAQSFRAVDQSELLYLHLDTGLVVVELNSVYAPNTVARIKTLAGAGFYNGKSFYRVIDGFVAQGGAGDDEPDPSHSPLPMEARRMTAPTEDITLVPSPDLFAALTGFKNGFAVGLDTDKRRSWLLHCPGTLGMSRANEPDSATTDFYIVIGQAPRYLDGIMTVFGRVIWGMDKVQQIIRADVTGSGIIPADKPQTHIRWAAIGAALPKAQQLALLVEETQGKAFEDKLSDRLQRPQAFFYEKPPKVLDVCQIPLRVKLAN
ncbi:peptidylprolyl isomerase [Simiduia curdlanivorans]|uniref:peptidylprolyl isomerase n=1 Tax=Simiduia curdlanivorans TaxID=1492769 RepID=A0ABV8V8T1_9GAMM|nr:peptidylprolyl isomerase [Simiduia curdlanivorans]MDN3639347.1 peptidylprolyl isomerase [Simiduia curdlanivorans]